MLRYLANGITSERQTISFSDKPSCSAERGSKRMDTSQYPPILATLHNKNQTSFELRNILCNTLILKFKQSVILCNMNYCTILLTVCGHFWLKKLTWSVNYNKAGSVCVKSCLDRHSTILRRDVRFFRRQM
jgi:hypothetical protein